MPTLTGSPDAAALAEPEAAAAGDQQQRGGACRGHSANRSGSTHQGCPPRRGNPPGAHLVRSARPAVGVELDVTRAGPGDSCVRGTHLAHQAWVTQPWCEDTSRRPSGWQVHCLVSGQIGYLRRETQGVKTTARRTSTRTASTGGVRALLHDVIKQCCSWGSRQQCACRVTLIEPEGPR